jgi:hypothetical protein
MEFTVRKFDILREVGLTQGVIEEDDSHLANFAVDAHGDSVQLSATDLELGIRVPAQRKSKAGAITAGQSFDYSWCRTRISLNSENNWYKSLCFCFVQDRRSPKIIFPFFLTGPESCRGACTCV